MIKKIVAVFNIVLIGLCSFACSPTEFDLIEDYSQVVSQLYQYGKNEVDLPGEDLESDGEMEPFLPLAVEQIEGLVPVYNETFSFSTGFFGDHAFCSIGNDNYLINKSGSLTKLKESVKNDSAMTDIIVENGDFDDIKVEYDNIIVKKNGKYGVLDLFGKLIAQVVYDEISCNNKIIIAKNDTKTDIYINRELKHTVNSLNVVALDADYLSINSKIVDAATLTEVRFAGNIIYDSPNVGIVRFTDSEGLFGYANLGANIVTVDSQYAIAAPFSDGIAYTATLDYNFPDNYYFGHYRLIDTQGIEVFDFSTLGTHPNNITPYPHYDGCTVFRNNYEDERYGIIVLAQNGADVRYLPSAPREFRAFGDYLFLDASNSIYSISDDRILSTTVFVVQAIGNGAFVGKSNGKYCILDSSLNLIYEDCDKVVVYENTVMIAQNGHYSLYKY